MGMRYSRCCEERSHHDESQSLDFQVVDEDGEDYPYTAVVTRPQTDKKDNLIVCLDYTPTAYEPMSTIDYGRSHARYARVVMDGAKAQGGSGAGRLQPWEGWIKQAVLGNRKIAVMNSHGKISPATYSLDSSLSTLSVHKETGPTQIQIDRIQLICPAVDFVALFGSSGEVETGKDRAVFVQYLTGISERQRVCFLAESAFEQMQFIQALTALWLDKRNEKAIWS